MRIGRRPVTESDRDFLFVLYASTRATELAMVPWNENQKRVFLESQFAAQSRGYQESHPDASHEILLHDGVDAGRLYLAREPQRIHILDITIAPWFRNAGIGTHVMGELIQEADGARLPLSIYVENFNRSRSLFGRLGFEKASEEGFMLFLRRAPSESGRSQAAVPASD